MATRNSWSRQQLTHLVGELKWNKRRSLRRCRKAHGFVRHAVDHLLLLLLLLLWRQQRTVSSLVLLLPQHACHSGACCVSCRRQGRCRENLQVSDCPINSGQKAQSLRESWGLFRNQSRSPCLDAQCENTRMHSLCDSYTPKLCDRHSSQQKKLKREREDEKACAIMA